MIKKLLSLLLIACAFTTSLASETYIVETGGNQSVTPYYAPQFLTINVGDTVIWDFVLGTHNVTTTSGPVSIESGDLQSPNSFTHIFTVAGVYDYECTLFSHADTQFGTITVLEPNSVAELSEIANFSVYPMPCEDHFYMDKSDFLQVDNGYLVDTYGRIVNISIDQNTGRIDLPRVANGLYVLYIESSAGILQRKIKVQK